MIFIRQEKENKKIIREPPPRPGLPIYKMNKINKIKTALVPTRKEYAKRLRQADLWSYSRVAKLIVGCYL